MIDNVNLAVRASIGIAVATGTEHGSIDLLRRADVAMYQAKKSGQGPVIYSPDSDPDTLEQITLASELPMAFESSQITAFYQPIVDTVTGRTVRVEALVRWMHPERGIIEPGVLLPLIDRMRLGRRLTRHMLERTVADMAAWQRMGHDVGVAVNITATDLADSTLTDEVEALLRRHGVSGSSLQLEVTEAQIATASEASLASIDRLKSLSVSLALDDFGTGYSSFAQLSTLPVDTIKIDRAFVYDIVTNPFSHAVVRATMALANTLNLRTTAEGIDTPAAMKAIASLGCHFAQGFLIQRPLALPSLLEFLSVPTNAPTAVLA
jgi:EAL domain-containing protein (putative c-di-GMP-specific phosphodiesterase class I)